MKTMNFPQRPQFGQQQGAPMPQAPQGVPAQRPAFAPGRPAGPPVQQFQPQPVPGAGAQALQQFQQRPAFRGAPQQGGNRQPVQARNPNPFAGIQQARAKQDANYETDGSYIEKIEVVRHKVGTDGLNLVIIEKTVLAVLAQSETGRTHVVGERVTHLIKEDLRYNYFLPEVKAFIANVTGAPEEEVTEQMMLEVLDEAANPLGGLVVEMQNRPKMTGQGKLITIRNYKRRLTSQEIQQTLAPEVLARFFPGDTLARMAQAEAAEVVQQQAAANSYQQPAPQLPPPPAPQQFGQGFYQQ